MEQSKPRYQHLGFRAFWMFLFMRGGPALAVAVILLALSFIRKQYGESIPPNLEPLLAQALAVLLLIFALLFAGAVVIALFQYLAYEFMVDEHALKIRSGIINIQVDAIPYRQMQNVDIERDLMYRVLGISRLVILTAASDDPDTGNESEAIIPAIDKNLGYTIQEELLKRANIERVTFDKHKSI